MIEAHALNKAAHITAGVAALTLGLVPLLTRKGSRTHRIGGWAFVAVGALVVASAVVGVLVFPQPGPLFAATLSASYQYIAGLRALARFRPGPGLIDAMLAAGALVACWTLLPLMHSGNASWRPATGYAILGFLSLIAVYDLSRHLWAEVWRRSVRPIDHGLKMTGAYFAMASAGLGNTFRVWQPWSQVSAPVLGTLVMVLLVFQYVRRRRRGRVLPGPEGGPDRHETAFA